MANILRSYERSGPCFEMKNEMGLMNMTVVVSDMNRVAVSVLVLCTDKLVVRFSL